MIIINVIINLKFYMEQSKTDLNKVQPTQGLNQEVPTPSSIVVSKAEEGHSFKTDRLMRLNQRHLFERARGKSVFNLEQNLYFNSKRVQYSSMVDGAIQSKFNLKRNRDRTVKNKEM